MDIIILLILFQCYFRYTVNISYAFYYAEGTFHHYLDRYAKSPESIRIPMALYSNSFSANATDIKFIKPLFRTSYVSTRPTKFSGNAAAYVANANSSQLFASSFMIRRCLITFLRFSTHFPIKFVSIME